MPATPRTRPRQRVAFAPAALLGPGAADPSPAFDVPSKATSPRPLLLAGILFTLSLGLTAHAQPDPAKEPAKKPADAKPTAKDPFVRLPDGTYLWLGNGADGKDVVPVTAQELQKLQDQIEQLKKQLAARKAMAPSGCAVRGRFDKRGEQLVAALKFTCTFRTAAPQTAVALGGRKGFLVAAALDGNNLPVLETTEDGLVALVETPGEHTLVLDIEAPVTARPGVKSELGFEVGLPRAAITTLLLDPPGPDVKRVNLTTRTPDAVTPARRYPGMDVKQLAPRPGQEAGPGLGPADSLEVTWDPPAAQPADQVQSADIEVAVVFTEGVVETTAKIRPRGPAREWRVVAPAAADLSVDRAAGTTDIGPAFPPTVAKPADPNKPVWKVEVPAGTTAADWVVTAVTRVQRPKPEDPKHRGPFAVGPFAVLDVLRQTGTVKVTAGPNTRFAFKHGPDLRRAEPPGPAEDDGTTAFFRLTTGPTGTNPVNAPLFTTEVIPLAGTVRVRPAYRLTLTEAGWRVRAEVKVSPIRTEVDAVTIEVPAEWRGLEASPPELVESVQPGPAPDGFWAETAAGLGGGRVPVVVRLAAGHRQPFDLVLTATVPVAPGEAAAALPLPLPRFRDATAFDVSVTASVPDGLEVHGEARGWNGDVAAARGTPLAPVPGPDGKPPRVVTAVTGRAEDGFAGVQLSWGPHRPDLVAEVRADVTVRDRQVHVVQQVKLRSPEGLPRAVRFRGPPAAVIVPPVLSPVGPGEWALVVTPDAKEAAVIIDFTVPLPPRPADDRGTWKIPVGLFWPAAATRAEAAVRVWAGTTSGGLTLTNAGAGWRELAVEPAPDRDALPAVALAGGGPDVPLVLEARDAGGSPAVTAWADRGLIQAWGADDGPTSYRARFLLRRWLAPAAEVRLPSPLAGPTPEFLRDGLKVEAVPVSDGPGPTRGYRVPLPEPRPGRTAVIEVRYQLPAARSAVGGAAYLPPTLPAVAFTGPVRWHVTASPGSVPLLAGGAGAEFRWRWRGGGLGPVAAGTPEDLDGWFRTGEGTGGTDPGAVLTARQPAPAAVTVYRVPRAGLVAGCSLLAFALVLGLARLPAAAVGPVVAGLAAAAGLAAVFFPHPAAVAAWAAQPGLLAAGLVWLAQAGLRWYYRHRVTYLPGFTRVAPEPSAPAAPVPSSARNRAPAVGSASANPVAPGG